MPRRILLTIMLLAFGLAAVLSNPPRARVDTTASRTSPAPRPSRQVAPVRASFPADATVTVTAGRVLELRVNSLEPDELRIDGLGVREPIGPGLSAPITLVAEPAGRYVATRRSDGKSIGTIVVSPRAS